MKIALSNSPASRLAYGSTFFLVSMSVALLFGQDAYSLSMNDRSVQKVFQDSEVAIEGSISSSVMKCDAIKCYPARHQVSVRKILKRYRNGPLDSELAVISVCGEQNLMPGRTYVLMLKYAPQKPKENLEERIQNTLGLSECQYEFPHDGIFQENRPGYFYRVYSKGAEESVTNANGEHLTYGVSVPGFSEEIKKLQAELQKRSGPIDLDTF